VENTHLFKKEGICFPKKMLGKNLRHMNVILGLQETVESWAHKKWIIINLKRSMTSSLGRGLYWGYGTLNPKVSAIGL
jgi:hypothetical protein